jgi:hypothetical protein
VGGGRRVGSRCGARGDDGGKSAVEVALEAVGLWRSEIGGGSDAGDGEAMLEAAEGRNRRLPQATGRAVTAPTGPTPSTTSAAINTEAFLPGSQPSSVQSKPLMNRLPVVS